MILKKIKKQVALICTLALTVTSLQATSFVSEAAEGDPVSIAVLSTTDMHGKCWDQNILNDTKVGNSLLRVSTAVKDLRQQYNNNVLLIDNGDTFQGTPVSSYSITTADENFTGETPMAIAMKYIGYDAYVLGNHEFNYPWNTMQKVYEYLESASGAAINAATGSAVSIPTLAANLVWKETKDGNTAGENVFTPYTMKDYTVNGETFTIGILGLENTDCTRWDVVDNYPNINFAHLENTTYDMVNEVNKYVPEMKDAGCDFIIVSYHSGLGSNDEKLEFGKNTENQVLRIISNTDGIDMIIAGHDHTNGYSNKKYKNKNGEDVVVVNGGGTGLTKTELAVTNKEDGSFAVDVTVPEKNIDLTKYTDDKALRSLIEPYAEAASVYVNQICGELAEADWDTKTKFYLEQTDTMDLINRTQIDRGNYYLKEKYNTDSFKELQKKYGENYTNVVDLSCTSVAVVNNYTVRAGDLSMKDIYRFYKYDNSLYILPLKGQEIKDILEFVASERLDVKFSNGKANFVTIGDSFTNPVFYGLDFTYDLAKPEGKRVTIKGFKNNKEFNLDQYYNLAINNYHLSNGPFENYKPEDTIWSQTDDLGGGVVQDLIKDFVGAAGTDGVKPDRSKWEITYSGEIPEEKPATKRPANVFDPISDKIFEGVYKDAVNVKEAKELSSGKGTVIGQVVCTYGTKYHIIEDVIDNEICGYLIYDSKNKDNVYKNGDIIAIEGDFANYNGLPEIMVAEGTKPTVIKSLGEDFMIAPQVVTVSQLGDDYINETVMFQNVPASDTEIKDATGKITLYSGAKLPEGITGGVTKVDATAVYSIAFNNGQLRNASSNDYVEHKGVHDPAPDSMFTAEDSKLTDAYNKQKGEAIVALGQVTYKYSSSNNAAGNKNNIIIQDVIDNETVGVLVYDKETYNTYGVGDVVRVTGSISEYGGLNQISATKVERLKVDVSFQPQEVTISQLGDDYISELVRIKDVTLGSYNGEGNTELKDATGSINVYKGAEPTGIKEGTAITVEGICSKYNNKLQLRVGETSDYIAPVKEEQVDETLLRIPVVETSDVHGFLVDVSSGKEDTYQYRMSYISDKVNDIREDETKGEVLLLDGGDIYQGNPVSNLLEGESMIAAYDAMDYDAVTLGNHEFDWEVTKLIDPDGTMGKYDISNDKGSVSGDSEIPVVCGNLYYTESGERVNFTKDYTIVEKEAQSLDGKKETLKVAIFGYVDDYSSDIMAAKIAPYKIDESKLEDIQKEAAKLEAEKKADISVMLTHASAASVAGSLDEDTAFDLVLGGHTHKDVTGTATKNGVVYVQPKNQAQSYAYVEICVDPETKEVTVENNETVPVYVSANKDILYNTPENAENLDEKIIEISNISIEEVAPIMNVEIGTITEQVTKNPINGNSFSSTAGTWVTEVMNQATGADVSLTNNGGIRTEFLFDTPTRTLTAGDIYTIAPFCNLLPTFEITYEKLKEIIEYGLGTGKSLALRMGGATAYYEGSEVKTLFVGKTLVYDAGEYKVNKDTKMIICTNEYIATSDTPFKTLVSREAQAGTSPLIDNEAFIAALKKEAKVNGGKLHVNTTATIINGAWDGKTIPEDYSHISDENNNNNNNNNSGDVTTPAEPDQKPVVTPEIPSKVETVETEISSKAVTAKQAADGFFYTSDGKKVTDAIVKTENARYILNDKGEKYVSTMVEAKNGNAYITDTTGAVITGKIVKTNGARYYTTKDTGKVVTNKLFKFSENKYFASEDGSIVTGKMVTVNGKKYYTTKGTGRVVQDQVFKLKGKKYIASKSGALVTSKWVTVGDKKFYCNKNGEVTKVKNK